MTISGKLKICEGPRFSRRRVPVRSPPPRCPRSGGGRGAATACSWRRGGCRTTAAAARSLPALLADDAPPLPLAAPGLPRLPSDGAPRYLAGDGVLVRASRTGSCRTAVTRPSLTLAPPRPARLGGGKLGLRRRPPSVKTTCVFALGQAVHHGAVSRGRSQDGMRGEASWGRGCVPPQTPSAWFSVRFRPSPKSLVM